MKFASLLAAVSAACELHLVCTDERVYGVFIGVDGVARGVPLSLLIVLVARLKLRAVSLSR